MGIDGRSSAMKLSSRNWNQYYCIVSALVPSPAEKQLRVSLSHVTHFSYFWISRIKLDMTPSS
jgi:hypothetical protein